MAWVSLGLRYRMLLLIMILQICIEDCSELCWTNSTVFWNKLHADWISQQAILHHRQYIFVQEILSSHGSKDISVGLLGCNAVWTSTQTSPFGETYCFHLLGWRFV
jgi:hypothetical protein